MKVFGFEGTCPRHVPEEVPRRDWYTCAVVSCRREYPDSSPEQVLVYSHNFMCRSVAERWENLP